jgi:hypothetical protein
MTGSSNALQNALLGSGDANPIKEELGTATFLPVDTCPNG